VRIYGKVAAYESGSRVELSAEVRLLKKPQVLKLAVAARELQNGDVFHMIAQAATPLVQSARR